MSKWTRREGSRANKRLPTNQIRQSTNDDEQLWWSQNDGNAAGKFARRHPPQRAALIPDYSEAMAILDVFWRIGRMILPSYLATMVMAAASQAVVAIHIPMGLMEQDSRLY